MDSKKARICELEFLELCTRIVSYRNNPTDIMIFLKVVQPFINFNPRIMTDLAREIFELKYKPNKQELTYLLNEKGFNLKDIGRLFNKSSASICLWLKEDIVLFPRCTKEQQTELINFMEQYNRIFAPDMRNLF